MNRSLLPFTKVPQFSGRDVAYATQDERLRPFYKYAPSLEGLRAALDDKAKDNTPRSILVEVLKEQYAALAPSEALQKQIASLESPKTFTVTTAHQPSLFTGPLYYIYKIISAINLARELKAAYPDYHFVPIFITGGEDHDFEEINHLQLFGNTVQWENDEKGAVGKMSTKTLQPVLEEVKEVLGDSPRAEELYNILKTAVESHEHYADTARHLTHLLFKDHELVILDPSHPKLKQTFAPYIKKEIFEQPSKALVEKTVAELEQVGFSEQAYPREINFFYLGDGFRERIVEEEGRYQVLNQSISWSKEELTNEIEQHPERFSPNVVMRPIYQEHILPNLAYIGGGGELAYWLERKGQFEHFGLNFPVLIRRNSVLFVDKGTKKRLDKLELQVTDLFGDVEALIKEYVKEHTENEISLKAQKEALETIFKEVEEKAGQVDPTLVKAAAAEGARQLNSLEQLEGKLMKAEKQRHDTAVNQMRKLKEKLFPNNGLQERYDNFMMYYLKYGDGFFELLLDALHPLEEGMVILEDA
jgi:bacillithiol biosynthesis cysteine-adding enzyme BshC